MIKTNNYSRLGFEFSPMAAFNYCGHTVTIGLLSHSVVAVEDKGSVLQPQKALVRMRTSLTDNLIEVTATAVARPPHLERNGV
jgi:hypothetical protein